MRQTLASPWLLWILWISVESVDRRCLELKSWPIVAVNWTSCPVLSDETVEVNNVRSQCMRLNVPVDWSSTVLTACSPTIELFVKRYFVPGHEDTSHHLWRIPGGGGIPVSTLELEATAVVAALSGQVSIYVTDKRGVGQSSLLECPSSIIQSLTDCLSYIRQNEYRLKQNTFTNTARDLAYVLSVVAGQNRKHLLPTQRVILMGSSQGTYLLQRYMAVTQHAEQVDGIILDSVLPVDAARFTHGDQYLNYVFLDLFSRCAQDESGCAHHFEGKNPIRALYSYKMNEDLRSRSSCLHRVQTTTTELAKKMSFVFYPAGMQLLPALIHRINRCNADDERVLRHFLNVTKPPSEDGAAGYSILVELNNNLAELWSSPDPNDEKPSCDFLKGSSASTFAATHVMPDVYCPIERMNLLGYPTDQFYRKYPTQSTDVPILLLHGDMDQALPVPIARHVAQQFSSISSNFTYVEMPRTGHTTTNAAPMDDEPGNCGWNLAASFVLSPTFQPDRLCLAKISQIDFAGVTARTKQVALEYFGTEDVWGTSQPKRL